LVNGIQTLPTPLFWKIGIFIILNRVPKLYNQLHEDYPVSHLLIKKIISNFTILTQLCDFFAVFLPLFFNTNNFFIGNFTILTQLCDFFAVF
jgi:hypothetical protein